MNELIGIIKWVGIGIIKWVGIIILFTIFIIIIDKKLRKWDNRQTLKNGTRHSKK